jgi:hypothetical protein
MAATPMRVGAEVIRWRIEFIEEFRTYSVAMQ